MHIKIPNEMKNVALLAMIAKQIRNSHDKGWFVNFLKKGNGDKDEEILMLIEEVLRDDFTGNRNTPS